MPEYALKCACCGKAWTQYARFEDRDSITCCGKRAETDFAQQTTRRHWLDTEFCGSKAKSARYEFLPMEVQSMRRKMGKHGACIKDNGAVVFNSRREEQGFHNHFQDHVFAVDPEEPNP